MFERLSKITMLITTVITLIGVGAMPVFAANVTDPLETVCNSSANSSSSSVCEETPENPFYGPDGILTKVITIINIVIGIAAVIMIIVSGLRFILSNGNSETVSSAKNGIIFAVVGILVAIFAQSIVVFVLNKL